MAILKSQFRVDFLPRRRLAQASLGILAAGVLAACTKTEPAATTQRSPLPALSATAPTAPVPNVAPRSNDQQIASADGLPFKSDDAILDEMLPGQRSCLPNCRGLRQVSGKSDLNVPFEFASAELTPQARAQLDELARAIERVPAEIRFEIAGHTDAVGEPRYNRRLSIDRARAAVDYLAGVHGVDPERLEPVGYGEERLLDGLNPEGAINRRVEVRPQSI